MTLRTLLLSFTLALAALAGGCSSSKSDDPPDCQGNNCDEGDYGSDGGGYGSDGGSDSDGGYDDSDGGGSPVDAGQLPVDAG